MDTHKHIIPRPDTRHRGSVYLLVLGASILVAVIGISSLMAARVQRRTIQMSAGMIQSRELAGAAIDRGLWEIKVNSMFWRMKFVYWPPTNVPLANGTFTLTATDPIDGNLLNNTADPVILTGIGKSGDAQYLLQVTLNGDGTVQPGTWKRVVN